MIRYEGTIPESGNKMSDVVVSDELVEKFQRLAGDAESPERVPVIES